VYADLGYRNAEQMLVTARSAKSRKSSAARGWTQVETANPVAVLTALDNVRSLIGTHTC
jgi:hypothetical protein